MTYNTKLSPALFERLQAHAVPLVDTIEDVIKRAVDALDAQKTGPSIVGESDIVEFKPDRHPSLKHTTPTAITLEGKLFPKNETYWNTLMLEVISLAHNKGHSKQEIIDNMVVNFIDGKKGENGYKFIEDVGISVQGQNTDGAWKQSYAIAKAFGFQIQASFYWQDKEDAAKPNTKGIFLVNHDA